MAKAPTEIRSLARSHAPMALNVLKSIANSKKAPAAARVSAAQAILDRGLGKPAQAITGDDQLDPIKVIHEIRRTLVESGSGNPDSEGV